MNSILRQILVIVVYAVTLVINSLASTARWAASPPVRLAIRYPIYFVPANLTFAIWGVIYLALTAFVVFQALPAQRENPVVKRISGLFVLSSLANALWLFLFQDLQFWLSVPVSGAARHVDHDYPRLEWAKRFRAARIG